MSRLEITKSTKYIEIYAWRWSRNIEWSTRVENIRKQTSVLHLTMAQRVGKMQSSRRIVLQPGRHSITMIDHCRCLQSKMWSETENLIINRKQKTECEDAEMWYGKTSTMEQGPSQIGQCRRRCHCRWIVIPSPWIDKAVSDRWDKTKATIITRNVLVRITLKCSFLAATLRAPSLDRWPVGIDCACKM